MTGPAIVLFAPKFREFGIDLASEASRAGLCDRVVALCTGGAKTVDRVRDGLGQLASDVIDLEACEFEWMTGSLQTDSIDMLLDSLTRELGPGAVGRTLSSDRRVGGAFVTGAAVRANWLHDLCLNDPVSAPTRYVAALHDFVDTLLRNTKPTFVFLYAVAGAPAFLLAELCRARQISMFTLKAARMSNLRFVDTSHMADWERPNQIVDAHHQGTLSLGTELEWASSYLADFRARPDVPEYLHRHVASLQSARSSVDHKLRTRLARARTDREIAKKLKPFRGTSPSNVMAARRHDNLRRRRAELQVSQIQVRLLRENRWARMPPRTQSYTLFPLHHDPEHSTMVLAPLITDQLYAVEATAKSLPHDHILAVKENPSMLGRRPDGFSERIASMPRTFLVAPDANGLDWIASASLVSTITGTAAFEAAMLHVPTVVLGSSPALAASSRIVHAPCPNKLAQTIETVLHQPIDDNDDDRLVRFIAATRHVSFEMRAGLLWSDYLAQPLGERTDAVRAIARSIGASYPPTSDP